MARTSKPRWIQGKTPRNIGQHADYLRRLARSAELLREEPRTARELAEAHEPPLTVMSAHAHLERLVGLGFRFETVRRAGPAFGPPPTTFRLVGGPEGVLPAPERG